MSPWRRLVAVLVLSAAAVAPVFPQDAPSGGPVPVLDIPYVPQSEALCGGAAAAMVMRFWGAQGIVAEDFSSLLDADGSGIRVDRLAAGVRARGWDAVALEGDAAILREQLAKRRPVIALVSVGRGKFHYVVVAAWAGSGVLAHDPAKAPDRVYAPVEFERAWADARHWMLVIAPRATAAATEAAPAGATVTTVMPLSPCDRIVAGAVAGAREGAPNAERLLTDALAGCPGSAAAHRELAGYAMMHGAPGRAAALAREAVRLDAGDAHAWYLLGAASYLQHDQLAALEAWNHIGEPTLDLVRVDGLASASYRSVANAIGIEHGSVVGAPAFARARRRIADLPAIAASRVDLQPQGRGVAELDIGIVERSTLPGSRTELAIAGARAAVDREAAGTFANVNGSGDAWTASWRWWENRPRVALSVAAPGLLGTRAVWHVDGSWAAESYAPEGGAMVREERSHAGIGASDWLTARWRWDAGAGLDRWAGRGSFALLSGALTRRSDDDRLELGLATDAWVGSSRFASGSTRVSWMSKTATQGWRALASGGLALTSAGAPLDVWPGAGVGHAREALLRAHPLLDGGVITGPAFGRALQHASASIERWPATARLWAIGAAAFVDAAAVQHRPFDRESAGFADAGAGARLKAAWLPGVLRVDYAHGLTDGADAVSVGWAVGGRR